MSFLNDFYDNNYGMMGTMDSINHMNNASANRQVAQSQAETAKEMQQMRQSQERTETEQKSHNAKMYTLAQSQVEEQKDREMRAGEFRSLLFFAQSFVDKVDSVAKRL